MSIKNTLIAATGFLALTGFALAEGSDGGCKGGGCKGGKGKTEKTENADQ